MEIFSLLLHYFTGFIDIMLHLDKFLGAWTAEYGSWIYLLAFAVIFAETGFVVTPFLPGDSLLFALGALTSLESGRLEISILSLLLFVAAFAGDNLNYSVGKFASGKWLPLLIPRFVKQRHLDDTAAFFKRFGPGAVILARFAPILRTYVPFVAGLTRMNRKIYVIYSFIGSIVWTQIFLWLGHFFGQDPRIQKNFSLLIVAIIAISFLPVIYGVLKSKFSKQGVS